MPIDLLEYTDGTMKLLCAFTNDELRERKLYQR
jgi:hypothetical protein